MRPLVSMALVLLIVGSCVDATPPGAGDGVVAGAGGRSPRGGGAGARTGGTGGTIAGGVGSSGAGGQTLDASDDFRPPDPARAEAAFDVAAPPFDRPPDMPAETPVDAAGETPSTACNSAVPGAVLTLTPGGGDPYAYFAAKMLLPIDGPSSGYITDTGCSFRFVLHQNGAEETVSSGALRQRNEVTVNPGNPAVYKATQGETMTYTWRFRIDQMNAKPTWCDVFQLKQHGGPTGFGPYVALQANGDELQIESHRLGAVRAVPLASVMGVWLHATLIVKLADAGSFSMTLRKDDGSVLMAYTNDNIDLWDTPNDFVRPKWGMYRNKAAGAGEAAVQYQNMNIFRGALSSLPPLPGPSCPCPR